jgi:hypothetical protein
MLRLGAAPMALGAPFKGIDHVKRDIANQELCHKP